MNAARWIAEVRKWAAGFPQLRHRLSCDRDDFYAEDGVMPLRNRIKAFWEVTLPQWIAWKLPRKVVYFATIRLFANASCGSYGTPDAITIWDAVGAWEDKAYWQRKALAAKEN